MHLPRTQPVRRCAPHPCLSRPWPEGSLPAGHTYSVTADATGCGAEGEGLGQRKEAPVTRFTTKRQSHPTHLFSLSPVLKASFGVRRLIGVTEIEKGSSYGNQEFKKKE